jgi:hypothetical protein
MYWLEIGLRFTWLQLLIPEIKVTIGTSICKEVEPTKYYLHTHRSLGSRLISMSLPMKINMSERIIEDNDSSSSSSTTSPYAISWTIRYL